MPVASARLAADANGIVAVWPESGKFVDAICGILKYREDIWSLDEWQQALGVAKVDWVRQVLLLCRAQARNAEIRRPSTGGRFVVLPGGQTVSIDLFWPDARGGANPLNAVPEPVLVVALCELFAEERSRLSFYSDGDLARKLHEWFDARGGRLRDGFSARKVQDLRARLKKNRCGHLLPNQMEREREWRGSR